MRISVGQFGPAGRVEDNLAVVGRLAARAAREGADLLVLPEETMFTFRAVEGGFAAAVTGAWEPFTEGLARLARHHGLAIVAGGYEPAVGDRPYNTLVAVDAEGAVIGAYRKLHLYDAFDHRESDLITPGDRGIVVVEVAGVRVGLQTCYDLRFPEVSRALAAAGAEVLAIPAAWFAGEHKVDHWRTLLRARAVENTVWVAAADTMPGPGRGAIRSRFQPGLSAARPAMSSRPFSARLAASAYSVLGPPRPEPVTVTVSSPPEISAVPS